MACLLLGHPVYHNGSDRTYVSNKYEPGETTREQSYDDVNGRENRRTASWMASLTAASQFAIEEMKHV